MSFDWPSDARRQTVEDQVGSGPYLEFEPAFQEKLFAAAYMNTTDSTQPQDNRRRTRDAEIDPFPSNDRPQRQLPINNLEGLLGPLASVECTEDGGKARTFEDGTRITSWRDGKVRIEKRDGTGAVLTPSYYKDEDGRQEKYYKVDAWGPTPESNFKFCRNSNNEFEIQCDAKELSPELKLLQSLRSEQFTRLAALTNDANKH